LNPITRYILAMILVTNVVGQAVDGTEISKDDAPNIYIDCNSCDMNYVRTELDYVNYVIDPKEAEIFIMITRETTGSGGRAYTLTLEGHEAFAGMQDTLIFNSEQDATWDEVREQVVERLEHGLFRYLLKTPLSESLSVKYEQTGTLEQPEDKWNYWVFRVNLDLWLNGEASYKSQQHHEHFNAKRVTEDWKFTFDFCANDEYDEIISDDTTYTSSSRRRTVSTLLVKSVTDHLSIGFTGGANTSTYSNIDGAIWLNPTMEYNIFPYSESTRRELRLKYRVGYYLNRYNEMTVYDKLEEKLLKQALDIDYELKQPWGSVEVEVSASHYFHDLDLNRLDMNGYISWKIVKGFSVNMNGNYSLIHDQISLAKGEATLEEIYLHRKQLETQYNYYLSMGVSYTFGSIYNNIVNPRF